MSGLSLQAQKLFKSGKLWLESEQPDSDWTAPPLLVTVLFCWIAFNWATSIRIGQPSVETWTDSRSEEHTSELQSLMRNSYAVFCLKKKKKNINQTTKQDQKQIQNIKQ